MLYAHWTMYGERTSAPAEEIAYPAGEEYTISFECAETDDSFGDITCTGGIYGVRPVPPPNPLRGFCERRHAEHNHQWL